MAREDRQRVVDALGGDVAARQRQHARGFPCRHAHTSSAIRREAHMVAVVPWWIAANRVPQDRIDKTDIGKQRAHAFGLPGKLRGVVHMLQLAATANAEYGAGRRDALWGRLDHTRDT